MGVESASQGGALTRQGWHAVVYTGPSVASFLPKSVARLLQMLVFTGCSAVLSIAAASAVLRRQPVRRVAIVGGTHGNELLGVQLVGMLQQRPEETKRPSFESMCVLANPEAVRQNTRYVTVDLNRCFSTEALAAEPGDSVEGRRAQELNAMMGPKASDAPQCDLCLDVHTTTSKMGTCLMMAREDDLAVPTAPPT